MKRIVLSLFLFFMPLSSFGQEEDTGGGPALEAILEKSLPPNPSRIIKVDPKTGTIIVRDTPSNQKRISEILKDIDIGPQQISIESRFVELKFTDLSEIGVNWGNSFQWYEFTSAPPALHSSDGTTISAQRDVAKRITGGTTPNSQGNLVTFPDTSTEGMFMQIARLSPIEFDMIIHALSRDDKANLLSAPKVTTINGQKANIQITRSVPYITEAKLENVGSSSQPIWKWDYTVAEEDVGITLVVTPRVGEESKIITLELEPEVEVLACRLIFISVDEDLGWPVIDRRSAKTTLMVQSGETVVMGGLLDDRDAEVKQKVPLLGDIPLLGNIFRHNYTKRVKKNLLIFVTASLINPEGKEIE